VLYQLRRPLTLPIDAPALPAGVRLRSFRPGVDDESWLRTNARAFADHPEQGQWTGQDLRERIAEPWFDQAGFLLAVTERDGVERLLGFHWTKVHAAVTQTDGTPAPPRERIGEVYVLGVDPDAQGTGLGGALTLAGLRYLRGLGLDQAMLYVDGDNARAGALYEKLGFTRWSTDVSYQRLH
jgi:mycothiol synthase